LNHCTRIEAAILIIKFTDRLLPAVIFNFPWQEKTNKQTNKKNQEQEGASELFKLVGKSNVEVKTLILSLWKDLIFKSNMIIMMMTVIMMIMKTRQAINFNLFKVIFIHESECESE